VKRKKYTSINARAHHEPDKSKLPSRSDLTPFVPYFPNSRSGSVGTTKSFDDMMWDAIDSKRRLP
jgi:hypothetical protein